MVRRNQIYGNANNGINLPSAGSENVILENVVRGNGNGISHTGTNGTRIEGNSFYLNLGRLTGPSPSPLGIGINIRTSTGVTVKNNSTFLNSGFDLYWDSKGSLIFVDNSGIRSLSALTITNTTNAARNPGFSAGDGYQLQAADAPANVPVYLHLFKDGKDLGITGPYGYMTDSQGKWLLTGAFDSSAIGSWFVQALFGGPGSSYQSGVISLTVAKPSS